MRECHVCGTGASAVYVWTILNSASTWRREPLCRFCAAILSKQASTASFARVEPLKR